MSNPSGGLRSYLRLFRTPGTKGFSSAGFLARMPGSMLGIGIVLLVQRETGSYAVASTVSATMALVMAGAAPFLARLVDRRGQAEVGIAAALVCGSGLGGLLVSIRADAPRWTLYLCALVIGLAMPNIGSMVRARWAKLHSGSPQLHTAYSFESVVDEVVFVVGPVLVTFLSTGAVPLAGLGAALACLVIGTVALCLQRGTQPDPAPVVQHSGPGAFRIPGVRALLIVFVGIGCLFGSVEVITVAYTGERHHQGAAGLLLAGYAGGSLIAGLIFGGIHWPGTPQRRFPYLLGLMALTAVPMPLSVNLWLLAAVLFLAGFSISPSVITGFTLVELLVPAARLTEGLATVTTGLAFGLTLGAGLAGPLIDDFGARGAYVLSAAGAASALIAAVLQRRDLIPAAAGGGSGPPADPVPEPAATA
jgi:hypothetical protein